VLNFYCSMLETEPERKKITELYEQHKHALYMYAFKFTKNRELAEDAVHNVFISIIKNKEKYFHLNRKDFRLLAVIIVKNKCIDLLRKQKPYSEIPIEEMELYLESGDMPVEEQIIISSEYDAIRKYLDSIDEISRQVLIMKYYFGYSYKEIGIELNMTPKHVDTRIMRAKDKIKKFISVGYYQRN